MIQQFLFKRIDNAQLIIFRIFFGLLMVAESWGAICTGWVKETFIEPKFTFTFMGFEWTQFLVGSFTEINFFGSTEPIGVMYFYFFVMGIFGWLITLGYKYRVGAIGFAIMWSLCYFMQKSHYNNHYYLVVLMSWFMALVPANRSHSIDAKQNPSLKTSQMFNWVRWFMIVQIGIVYFYAAVAKLYPGWWKGKFLELRLNRSAYWFQTKLNWDSFADFLNHKNIFGWTHLSFLNNVSLAEFLSYLGIGFDFLVVPFLLFKPTRKLAFIGALIFHLFNSITLHIGIFPYFALACCVFFFTPKSMRKLFFGKKEISNQNPIQISSSKMKLITVGFIAYFIWQSYLPIRHWLIKDDVLWTEEGHRLSWRMMLRTKGAITSYYITDLETNQKKQINLNDYLTRNQQGIAKVKPDIMWQFAQKIKEENEAKGKNVKVTVTSRVSVNGGPVFPLTNDTVNIANKEWKMFGHQDWILESPEDYFEKPNQRR